MTLTDSDELEGLAANDRSLIEGAGLFLTPPDTRSNTQRIYVPRGSIQTLEVIGLIGAGRGKRRAAASTSQPELFPTNLIHKPCSSGYPFRYNPLMKFGELANRLGAELRGDARLEVTGVKGIEEAGPGEITFVANPRYGGLARKTQAAAVLVEPDFPEIVAPTLRLENPYLPSPGPGNLLPSAGLRPGIHPTAVIDPSAGSARGAYWRLRRGHARCLSPPGSMPRFCPTWSCIRAFRPEITFSLMRMRWCGKIACLATT